MTELDLIKKFQAFKAVEADQEWLVSARQDIIRATNASTKSRSAFPIGLFRQLADSAFSLRTGAAIAGFLFIAIASGTLVFASNSLPGDALYGIKLASEGVQNSLPANDLAQAQRQDAIAQKRVNELTQVAQNINQSSDADTKDVSPAVAKQIASYNQALQQNAQALSQSSKDSAQKQSDDSDIKKVKDEAGIIQQSAQTLAIVLHQADNSADMEKALRATIGNRLPICKDEQMLDRVQKLLSSDEIADLIEANELSVRCTETKLK